MKKIVLLLCVSILLAQSAPVFAEVSDAIQESFDEKNLEYQDVGERGFQGDEPVERTSEEMQAERNAQFEAALRDEGASAGELAAQSAYAQVAEAQEEADNFNGSFLGRVAGFFGFSKAVALVPSGPRAKLQWGTSVIGVISSVVLGPVAGLAVGVVDRVFDVGPRVTVSSSGLRVSEGSLIGGLASSGGSGSGGGSSSGGSSGGGSSANGGSGPSVDPLLGSADNSNDFRDRDDDSSSYTELYQTALDRLSPEGGVMFNAEPDVVARGGSVRLFWQTSGVDTCTASGNWSGPRGISGVENIADINVSNIFHLSCSGASYRTTKTLYVAVDPRLPPVQNSATSSVALPSGSGTTNGTTSSSASGEGTPGQTVSVPQQYARPSVTISATPPIVSYGGSARLSWASQNASSCYAGGDFPVSQAQVFTRAAVALSGDMTVGPLYADKRFVITCANSAGAESSASASVLIATD